MLKNLLNKKRQEGFSIVEVMIVLAIAGLIILVVFLAVPALQRNSRNTEKRSVASSVASLVGEYRSANGGKNPTTIALATEEVTLGAGNTVKTSVGTNINGVASTGVPADGNKIVMLAGQKCDSASSHGVSASPRSAAILYFIETAGGTAPQCIEA